MNNKKIVRKVRKAFPKHVNEDTLINIFMDEARRDQIDTCLKRVLTLVKQGDTRAEDFKKLFIIIEYQI